MRFGTDSDVNLRLSIDRFTDDVDWLDSSRQI
jgi:hypothetical protein